MGAYRQRKTMKRSPMKPGSGFKPSAATKDAAFGRTASKEATAIKKLRLKKCSTCRQPFEPRSAWAKACSPECAAVVAKLQREAEDRKVTKAKLIELKPLKWWRVKAKTAMHAYVRAIAEGKPCISCDTILLKLGRPGGDYDAGHFRSVGSAKHLEFDERNIFGQCKHCNDFMKGNQLEYERRLRLLKGDAYVDELRADNAPRHLKIADFQKIEAHYKHELKQLQGKM